MSRVKSLTPLSAINPNILKGSKIAKKTIPKPLIPKKKFVPGKVLREIKTYQSSTKLLIPKATFQRFIKNIVREISDQDIKFQKRALNAVQYAIEHFMISILEEAYFLSIHSGRKTLFYKDIKLIYRIKYCDSFYSEEMSK